MRFYSFVLKNVVRRRVRSSLTIIGVALAVGAVVALVGVSRSTERSFKKVYETQNVAIIVQQSGKKQRLTSILDTSLGKEIEKIHGVKAVNPGLVEFSSLEELPDAVVMNGWEIGSPLMKKLKIKPGGRNMEPGDERCVLLGEQLAVALDKQPGDKLSLFEADDYTVVGVFESPISYETRSMVLSLHDLQRFSGRKDQVTGFAVIVDHPENDAEIKRICAEIEALAPRIDALSADDSVSKTTEIRFISAMAWLVSAIAIIIGVVLMVNTMIMSVSERTREIGILRAIGWRQTRIVRMILLESFLLSLCGGVIGAVSAIVLTSLLSRHPSVAGLIDTEITGTVVVFGIFSALCVGLLGAAYPAYRGARLLPTEALRHE
ncbi:MAG: ABC transporter permease [Pirellulaceae bacterium]|nr:ABC transporter permease [Pirellulaceae bacterium]